jgi:hypothetical protein
MYPNAAWDRLKTMGFLTAAVFILDDAIDKEIDDRVTDYASDYASAARLRDQCVAFTNEQLGLGDPSSPWAKTAPKEFAAFAHVASDVLGLDSAQVHIPALAKSLEEFIRANGPEQKLRLEGKIPTVEQYWSYRHGIGAVFVYATLHQYVADTRLPAELAWSDEVMVMRVEASFQPSV